MISPISSSNVTPEVHAAPAPQPPAAAPSAPAASLKPDTVNFSQHSVQSAGDKDADGDSK
jgi:hypothetical protein